MPVTHLSHAGSTEHDQCLPLPFGHSTHDTFRFQGVMPDGANPCPLRHTCKSTWMADQPVDRIAPGTGRNFSRQIRAEVPASMVGTRRHTQSR